MAFEKLAWHNECFFCAICKVSMVGKGFIQGRRRKYRTGQFEKTILHLLSWDRQLSLNARLALYTELRVVTKTKLEY